MLILYTDVELMTVGTRTILSPVDPGLEKAKEQMSGSLVEGSRHSRRPRGMSDDRGRRLLTSDARRHFSDRGGV